MKKVILVVPVNPQVDLSEISSALAQAIQSRKVTAAHLKAVDARDMGAIKVLLSQGELDLFFEQLVERCISRKEEIIILEGMSYSADRPYALQFNVEAARALNAKVILAASKSAESRIDMMSAFFGDKILQGKQGTQEDDVVDRIIKTKMPRRLTPVAFKHRLIDKARAANKRIVLPDGTEHRTLEAANICVERHIARCVVLGKRADIEKVAEKNGITLNRRLETIDPETVQEHYVQPMVALRKHKGLTEKQAREELKENTVLGTMMLQMGEVDGLVSGAMYPTADTIRPALQLIKTVPEVKLVSSVFFMCLPEEVVLFGDCAINPNPTPEQLADIAIQSAESAKAFGIVPRVAMISYSTGKSGSGPDVEKVREATQIAQKKRPGLLIEGPMQYDAAMVPDVGRSKAPGSKVAGKATVLVFPDLNTGNTAYKAVQRSAKILSIGPMLQGLRKPVNDLSRGCLVDDIVFTIALTAVQAISVTAAKK